MNCGRVIPKDESLIGYYTRPSVRARYFGLRALCAECSHQSLEWASDYIISRAANDINCGDWLFRPTPETVTGGEAPPDNDLPADPKPGFGEWSKSH